MQVSQRRSGIYYGWYIIAVCVLANCMTNSLTYSTFTMFLQDWSKEFHAPISLLQLCVLGMMVPISVFCPFSGLMTDRYPIRTLMMIGVAGIGVFYFAVSLVHSAWALIILYIVLAPIPLNFSTSIPANALISRWFVRRLGLALGLATFGLGMAGVLIPPLVAALLPVVGWRVIWRIGGAVMIFVVLPLIFLVLRQRPTEREGLHYVEGATASGLQHHPIGQAKSDLRWRDVLTNRNFWLIILGFVSLGMTSDSVAQNLSPYILALGWSPKLAGGLLPVLNFSNLIATLLLGIFSDRFGIRKPLAALSILTAVGALIFAFGGGFYAIAAGCAFVGFAAGINTLMAAAIAREFGAKGFGRAYGMSLFFVPFLPASAVITARVKEVVGSYQPVFLCLAGLLAISCCMTLLFFREKRDAQLSEPEKLAMLEQQAPPSVL